MKEMTICCPSSELAAYYKEQLEAEILAADTSTIVTCQPYQESNINIDSEGGKGKYDAIVTCFNLQTNDHIEQAFGNLMEVLAEDGVLLGIMPGAESLKQLRNAFYIAENERFGGFEERMLALPTASSLGNTLNKFEYQMTSIHSEKTKLLFNNSYELIDAIKNWGMGNIAVDAPQRHSRDLFLAVCAFYSSFYDSKDFKGKVEADFEVFRFIGYKPKAGQIGRPKKTFTVTSFKDYVDSNAGNNEFSDVKFGYITENEGLVETQRGPQISPKKTEKPTEDKSKKE